MKNDSIKKYYQDATKLELQYGGKIFETYRSHGVVHIIDVLTETIDSLQSLKKLGININDEQMDTAMLAAIMHVGSLFFHRRYRYGSLARFAAYLYRSSHH